MDVFVDLDTLELGDLWLANKSTDHLIVPIDDLLNPGFMAAHTQFASLQHLLDQACLSCRDTEQWKVSKPQLDAFLAANTDFECLDKLCAHASKHYQSGRSVDQDDSS